MGLDILLGLQWGDEGKGKVVDVLTPKYDIIARFQGGPNAGHTLEFDGIKHILHIIPSGIFHADKVNIIGNGVVIDPVIFRKEVNGLLEMNVDPKRNLFISKKAHLILPTHKLMDMALEHQKGERKIGSTLKGIGPTYTDKTARVGLRVLDLFTPNFVQKYKKLTDSHRDILDKMSFKYEDTLHQMEKEFVESIELLTQFRVIDNEYELYEGLKEGKSILAEGAQGTLLDVEFGSYPFVTSSSTVAAGAYTGLGLNPSHQGRVIGIVKAYCTRVGSGPFPTELFDQDGEKMRKQGFEFGSTTGRPRRCGWLDLVALKYAVMINGVTEIVLTKADVLTGFKTVKICTQYKINGEITDRFPADSEAPIQPQYRSFEGWDEDITKIKKYEQLPEQLKQIVNFIEQETGVKVSIVSVGPDRDETLIR
ncbi:MAG: adenylosuccinate synthase [Bacteroidales bacterium]|jgi:adenylosuccinate synthase|nr:adenylosuccinate synthase [Bacteroidales bacterium]HHT51985.1 adenylosuccinate synthase [Bacteroidales bacterium]